MKADTGPNHRPGLKIARIELPGLEPFDVEEKVDKFPLHSLTLSAGVAGVNGCNRLP